MTKHFKPVSQPAISLLCLLVSLTWIPPAAALTVTSTFNQQGISGTITFTQLMPSSPTSISVDLQGLDQSPNETYPWHVHLYPFPLGIQNPCAVATTGGHYDPLGASQVANYSQLCDSDPAVCELGDLSGKFGRLNSSGQLEVTDPTLSLYGRLSIVGRSVVVHRGDTSRFVCANIGYPASDPVELLYTPFRTIFSGSVYFRQYTNNSTSTVYADLIRTDGTTDSSGHNWHVHESPVSSGDSTCASAGPHYNPREIPVGLGTNYSTLCSPSTQSNCEIGDLSGKGSPLDVENGVTKMLYTDTDLPLLGEDLFIVNRSVVIHKANETAPRLSCSNIVQFRPLEAVASFDEDGVKGEIKFVQNSPFDETEVTVSLTGLRNLAMGYHVHEFPIGPQDSGSERCGVQFAGGHWNPLGVVYMAPQITSDQFEIGDLSGKFGGLNGRNDISETYHDPNIPLSGRYSILGRSIVIHYPNGSRWLCANVEHAGPIIRFSTTYTIGGEELRFTFVQPADNPFAETSITIEGDLEEVFPQPTTSLSLPSSTSPSPSLSSPSSSSPSLSSPSSSSPSSPSPSSPSPSSSSIFSPNSSSLSQNSTSFAVSPTVAVGIETATMSVLSRSLRISPSSSTVAASTSSPQIGSASLTSFVSSSVPTTLVTSVDSGASSSSVTVQFIMPTASLNLGSGMGVSESGVGNLLMPFSTDLDGPLQTPSPTATPNKRRRKRQREEGSLAEGLFKKPSGYRVRRQSGGVGWSLRSLPAGEELPSDCSSLAIADPYMSVPSSSSCSPSSPLACSAGDLTGKHGSLGATSGRAVFSDPNLPLSGANSILGLGNQVVLLLEPMSPTAGSSPACALVVMDISTPSSSATPTSTPTSSPTPIVAPPAPDEDDSDDNVALIAAVVGGVGGAILLVAVIVIVVLCCWRCRMRGYNLSKAKDKNSAVELGTIKPTTPQIGSSQYRALHDYTPQNKDDLALTRGAWVTLIEAPYGGEWWKGSIEKQEGWFPKSYVEWVNVEAERKRVEEENFKIAAAAIVAASSSFSTRHGSLSRIRAQEVKPKDKSQRTTTFSRQDIDSTPKMVTRFDRGGDKQQLAQEVGGLDLGAELEAVVIENVGKEGSSGGSRPDTPKSQRAVEVITNTEALDESPAPSPLPWSRAATTAISPLVVAATSQQEPTYANVSAAGALPSDIYIAKYDFGGSTDIELQLRKGDVVNIIERADNGWWKGMFQGRIGWFPETYVRPPSPEESREIQVEQPRGMDEMMARGGEEFEASEYRAILNFQSEMEGDLKFGEGDTVLVYWAHDSGWWYGAARAEQGWFPGSYVEPIVDVSAAASMTASPAPESQPTEESSLANEITAALESREAKMKEGSLKKRRKWSFRFGKDKSAGSEAGTSRSESVSSPTGQSPRSLQDEISQALLRSASTSSPTGVGEGRHLSIDERLALAKETRSEEGHQNELTAALTRRIRTSDSDQPGAEPPSPVKEEAQPELKTKEPTPQVETEKAAAPEAEPVAQVVEKLAVEEDRREKEAEESGQKAKETAESGGGVGEAAKEKEEGVTPEKDGSRSRTLSSEANLTPSGTPDSIHRNKPRRKAPPPPAVAAIATPTAGGSSPSPNKVQRTVTTQPKSSTLVAKPTQTATPAPPPARTHTLPAAAPSPSPAPKPSPPKPAPTRTPPSQKGAQKIKHKKGKEKLEPLEIPKSFTMVAPRTSQQSSRVIPKPRKRRTTGLDHKSKPRRRPPPPPLTPGGVAVLPPVPAARLATVSEDSDNVFVGSPVAATISPSQPTGKVVLPKPAPRMRPRVQRVKRPLSRNIPPPPNIPLPPPPVRKRKTAATESSAPTAKSSTTVQTEVVTTAQREAPPTRTPSVSGEQKPAKPPLKPKPAVLPKPAHVAKIGRTYSESSISSSSSRDSEGTQSPRSVEGDSAGAARKLKGPKPPPPARTSSLSGVGERPKFKKQQRISGLPSISDAVEETDSSQVKGSGGKEAGPAKLPPPRPSPPKPTRADRPEKPEVQVVSDVLAESTEEVKSKVKTNPPNYPPPPRPSTTQANGPHVPRRSESEKGVGTHGKILFDTSRQQQQQEEEESQPSTGSILLAKSSSFMRSLKKIVKRSESQRESKEEKQTGLDDSGTSDSVKTAEKNATRPKVPPPRPQPPKAAAAKTTDNESVAAPTEVAPVPKPRTKLQDQTSEEQQPLMKPPPPETEPERSQAKPPARPPPPNKVSTGKGLETKVEDPSDSHGGEEPVSHRKGSDSEAELSETLSKPAPTPRKSSTPSPTDPVRPSSPADDSPTTPTNFYRAARDYKAEKEGELTFTAGDILIVIEHQGRGFHYGMLDDGNTGLFPTSHVEPFYTPSSRRKN